MKGRVSQISCQARVKAVRPNPTVWLIQQREHFFFREMSLNIMELILNFLCAEDVPKNVFQGIAFYQ